MECVENDVGMCFKGFLQAIILEKHFESCIR